jgi:hypothetical protein
MEYEQTFICGNSKYYVTKRDGFFIVRRQGWIARTFIGYSHDLAEALALIRHDAQSSGIRAA